MNERHQSSSFQAKKDREDRSQSIESVQHKAEPSDHGETVVEGERRVEHPLTYAWPGLVDYSKMYPEPQQRYPPFSSMNQYPTSYNVMPRRPVVFSTPPPLNPNRTTTFDGPGPLLLPHTSRSGSFPQDSNRVSSCLTTESAASGYSTMPSYPGSHMPVPLPLMGPLSMRFGPYGYDPGFEEEKVVTTGHWSRKEECILLTIVKSMLEYELKVIAQAAWDCNIHRNSRAVDKKLKRLIHYQTWKDRSHEPVLERIDAILKDSTYKLTESESKLVQSVITKYSRR